MADPENDYKFGDTDNNLLRKILARLKSLVGLGGGPGGDVTLTVSDIEIGAVELKDGTTDTRAKIRTSDPDPSDPGLVVRNIPSGTQAVSVSNFPAVQPVSDNGGSLTVDGPLTDAQLALRINLLGRKSDTISTSVALSDEDFGLLAYLPSIFNDLDFLTSSQTVNLNSLITVSNTLLKEATFTARINTLGRKAAASSTPIVFSTEDFAELGAISGATQYIPNASFDLDILTNFATLGISDILAQTLVDNSVFTDGTSKVFLSGHVFDEIAGTALTENDAAVSRIDSKRAQVIAIEDETTRGRRLTITAANAAKVDGSAVTQPVTTKIALTASSPTFATVGVTSAQAVASNANRKGLVLINTSINSISIGFGAAAVLGSGITLAGGDSFTMDEYTFNTGAINAIASIAASNLAIQEFTT